MIDINAGDAGQCEHGRMTSQVTSHLSAEQLAQLGQVLRDRDEALRARLHAQYGHGSRVEHAREVLLQDGDDAPQRDSDREVDLATSDLETVELDQIALALARIQWGSYGHCIDCAAPVPFARLQVQPTTQRCVACEAAHET